MKKLKLPFFSLIHLVLIEEKISCIQKKKEKDLIDKYSIFGSSKSNRTTKVRAFFLHTIESNLSLNRFRVAGSCEYLNC